MSHFMEADRSLGRLPSSCGSRRSATMIVGKRVSSTCGMNFPQDLVQRSSTRLLRLARHEPGDTEVYCIDCYLPRRGLVGPVFAFWVWVKNRHLGQWNQGSLNLRSNSWWIEFDPYPFEMLERGQLIWHMKPGMTRYSRLQRVIQGRTPTYGTTPTESQSKHGTKMVYTEPCKELRRRPQVFTFGIVLY